jgi:hypothetical protein
MTNTNVEMFLIVTGKAMIKAAESNDPNMQHEVIKNFIEVGKDWEHRAFNAAYMHMLESRES